MPRPTKLKEKFRLEEHLLLPRFIGSKIGIREVKDIKDFADVPEGNDSDGRSYMYSHIISRKGVLLDEAKLQQYDQNIRRYAENMSKRRGEPINLKYYQYLALLYTEIHLDKYFQNIPRPVLLNEINEWAVENSVKTFNRKDLKKLAYWMATGSGKTHIAHANYWQFLNYNKGVNQINYDNIIIVTSNDGMSQQHLDELRKSGIPATLFQGDTAGYFQGDRNTVKVISIHKLKLPEDRRGKVESIDISRFGTKNLVFVDEGHKGQSSEDQVWKRVRELLAKDGFTFEYSATFGQVITSKEAEAYNEYTKSIIFDYSYKYFNGDGYGKDFRLLNLDAKEFAEIQTKALLLADTLTFYEQLSVYRQLGQEVKHYNIERPLWVFVGSKVEGENSNIVEVVEFLDWFLTNETDARKRIGDILAGVSGIISDGRDVFTPTYPERNFPYLRELGVTPDEAYEGILREVFHLSPGQGRTIQLIDLKNAEGEIALAAGASPRFFAVINVGDKPGLLKLIAERQPTLPRRNDELSPSQFKEICKPDSSINILIGAKKFIEGWNSWRVSNMCLLNVGRSEGPQIIQLFGRGVRLKGRGSSLKRSRFIEGPHPHHIEALETLHIYGVQANYMETFKQAIEQEDVPTYVLKLPTRPFVPFPDDLQTLVLKEGCDFADTLLKLEVDDKVKVSLNLLPRAEVLDSRGWQIAATISIPARSVSKENLDLLDWDTIHHNILEYKTQREFYNIFIDKEVLKTIMYENRYTLYCAEELIIPKDFQSLETVKEVVTQILRKYLDRFHSTKRTAYEKDHVELKPLKEGDENVVKTYTVKIAGDNKQYIDYVKKIIDEKTIYDRKENIPPEDIISFISPIKFRNALYKGHLYQPLLIKQENDRIVTIPTGLNEGEARFVEDLNKYLTSKAILDGVYLLRNQTRGKGIGFYEHHSFYPDFIIWIKKDKKQTIVFIDPKGLTHLSLEDEKLNLHKHLAEEIQPTINNPAVKLDAFIVSVTPHNEAQNLFRRPLPLDEYDQRHLLFQELKEGIPNPNYIERLFSIAAEGD